MYLDNFLTITGQSISLSSSTQREGWKTVTFLRLAQLAPPAKLKNFNLRPRPRPAPNSS
jgi:hypothetical protein